MLTFTCRPFPELTVFELYDILKLRLEVFSIEQKCYYQDCDGHDLAAWHFMIRDTSGKLLAYTRLLPKDSTYQGYISIGRVVTAPSARGTGIGKLLMEKSIEQVYELFGKEPLKIGAQSYLLQFYKNFGFQPIGEEYLEDGIPHTYMVMKA